MTLSNLERRDVIKLSGGSPLCGAALVSRAQYALVIDKATKFGVFLGRQPRPQIMGCGPKRPPTFWDLLRTCGRTQHEQQQPNFACRPKFYHFTVRPYAKLIGSLAKKDKCVRTSK